MTTTVLLIGATSAIATACARRWAARGATLFLVARDPAKLDALAADLGVRGAAAVHRFVLDVDDDTRHAPMLAAALAALGRLDIALIAHGTLPDQAACQADPQLAAREFGTNATATIALLTRLAAVFEAQRSGHLAVISSVAGDRGRPSNHLYGSAKAAVQAYAEGLRGRLFKAGVSVTDIRPGFVATPMTQGLALPGALVVTPQAIAPRLVAGIERGAGVLYAPAFWALVMALIRAIPRSLFKRLSL